MRVRVRYHGILAFYSGHKMAEVEAPEGATIAGFLEHLTAINPPEFKGAIRQGDGYHAFLRILHNGRLLGEDQLGQKLAEGDEVSLFPAISGG